MVHDASTPVDPDMSDESPLFNVKLLRGWSRSQLKLLKTFVTNSFVDQTLISGASGYHAGSHGIGGKITPFVRADLITKAGKDENGQMTWQLNEKKVDKKTIKDLLDDMNI